MSKRIWLIRCGFSLLFALTLYCVFKCKEDVFLEDTFWWLKHSSARGTAVALVLFFVSAICGFPPLTSIFVLCGSILPVGIAMAISVLGSALCFSVSYFLGYVSQNDGSALLMALSDGGKNGFLASFVLRAVRFIPWGSVGVHIGKAHLPFLGYLLGSAVGVLPSIALSVSLGVALAKSEGVSAFEVSSYIVALSTFKLFFMKLFIR